jgi:tripartite-type tricarboxylate transporter receptor subunit TctC
VKEAGLPGYEVVGWYAIVAPAGTPQPVVTKLYTDISSALLAPDMREKLAAEGAEAVGSRPEEFSAFLKSEIDKWGKVVKVAKIPMQ